jgi:glutamyl-tRNA synthetase
MATGRFAPSQSGPLHLGNLRTALLAWLSARATRSSFLLRIEDIDRERSRPEHERRQIEDLRAIGVDWDGDPVRQSERTGLYRAALERLEAAGRVYPCWCTRAEIQAATEAPHGPLPDGAYPGTCRRLTVTERTERERIAGRPPSLRLDGRGERLDFDDRLHGRVEGAVDDFVLWRWDDTPAYNLAVVVDDADQGVGEVVRGDDLIDSTPRQLLLYRLLGLSAPAHAHVPLVLGPDGARLAKRHGAVTLADRAGRGENAADALAWMAVSLGLAKPGEPIAATDLIDRFDPRTLPHAPTVLAPTG